MLIRLLSERNDHQIQVFRQSQTLRFDTRLEYIFRIGAV
jgi:hypothetical protein